jgi:hypothetical protein
VVLEFQDRCLKPLGHPSRVCQLGNTAVRKIRASSKQNQRHLANKGAAPKDGPAHATPLRNFSSSALAQIARVLRDARASVVAPGAHSVEGKRDWDNGDSGQHTNGKHQPKPIHRHLPVTQRGTVAFAWRKIGGTTTRSGARPQGRETDSEWGVPPAPTRRFPNAAGCRWFRHDVRSQQIIATTWKNLSFFRGRSPAPGTIAAQLRPESPQLVRLVSR